MDYEEFKERRDEISERLHEMGFSGEDVNALMKVFNASYLTKAGDAFAKAKMNRVDDSEIEKIASTIQDAGYEYSAERIREKTGSLYMSITPFVEEKVIEDG